MSRIARVHLKARDWIKERQTLARAEEQGIPVRSGDWERSDNDAAALVYELAGALPGGWPNQIGIVDPDYLVVLDPDADTVPGEYADDRVRAVALIDLARHVIDIHENGGTE